jgi:hypothetical protein
MILVERIGDKLQLQMVYLEVVVQVAAQLTLVVVRGKTNEESSQQKVQSKK